MFSSEWTLSEKAPDMVIRVYDGLFSAAVTLAVALSGQGFTGAFTVSWRPPMVLIWNRQSAFCSVCKGRSSFNKV